MLEISWHAASRLTQASKRQHTFMPLDGRASCSTTSATTCPREHWQRNQPSPHDSWVTFSQFQHSRPAHLNLTGLGFRLDLLTVLRLQSNRDRRSIRFISVGTWRTTRRAGFNSGSMAPTGLQALPYLGYRSDANRLGAALYVRERRFTDPHHVCSPEAVYEVHTRKPSHSVRCSELQFGEFGGESFASEMANPAPAAAPTSSPAWTTLALAPVKPRISD